MRLSRIIFATLFTLAGTTSFAQTPIPNDNTKISVPPFKRSRSPARPTSPSADAGGVGVKRRFGARDGFEGNYGYR